MQQMSRHDWQRVALAVAFVTVVCGLGAVGGQQDFRGAPVLPIDRTRELALKIVEPFTLASVGDLIIMRPATGRADPGLRGAIQLIKDADVAFGNFEGSLVDFDHYNGPLRGFVGTKEVAADLKTMGFDLLNRANNHLFDSEVDGMRSTNALLDDAGLVHAGSGNSLELAQRARYVETSKGRVGLVGMHTPIGGGRLEASAREGTAGGKPGLNAIGLTPSFVVTQEQLDGLRKVRNELYDAGKHVSNPVDLPLKDSSLDRLLMFGTWYSTGGTPGTKSYAMNNPDLQGTLRSIRNGKVAADFMIATIHSHQGPWVAQRWAYEDEPPDFLKELARLSIDNGADAFVGHGPHVIRGVEIYKGKPIFYGLGEFFREMELTVPYGGRAGGDSATADLTEVELLKQSWERGDTRAPIMYESLLAQSKYDGGRLVEVRLHPIDLRYDEPISRVGVPRIAPPAIGRRILERVQTLSKRLGTPVVIEGNVGIIRPAPIGTSAGAARP